MFNAIKPRFYGTKIKGLTHTSTEDFWIRRLQTTLLAGNGAALVLLLQFLKGDTIEKSLENASNYSWPIWILMAGVAASSATTIIGAFETSLKTRYFEDYTKWHAEEFHEDMLLNKLYSNPKKLFGELFPSYSFLFRLYWTFFYSTIAGALASIIFSVLYFAVWA